MPLTNQSCKSELSVLGFGGSCLFLNYKTCLSHTKDHPSTARFLMNSEQHLIQYCFEVHDGILYKRKFNGLKQKLKLPDSSPQTQQNIADCLNHSLNTQSLKVVKYGGNCKTYYASNLPCLERGEDGKVTVFMALSPPAHSPATNFINMLELACNSM